MKKLKTLFLLGVLLVSTTASAQFTNMGRPTVNVEDEEIEVPTGLKKGFHAIIEAGYSIGAGDYQEDRPLLTLSLGYQFNPYIYLGAGVGGAYFLDSEVFAIPIFANFRVNFINNRISPFVDVKGGYSPADAKGGYASIGAGCRFNKFSLSLGYELLQAEAGRYGTVDCWGYFGKVGIEF